MADQERFTLERMLDWLEGRLTETEATQMAAALETGAPAIQEDLRWLRAFLAVRQEINLVTPPAAVRADLMQRFEEQMRNAQTPNLWQQLVAALQFDSNLATGLAGARSTTSAGPRQLIYGSDYADVVLNVRQRPESDSIDLMGQVLPHGDVTSSSFTVQLLAGDSEIAITNTDELGEFVLFAAPASTYTLILSSDNVEIQIAPLALSAG
ncbi:hypothetical protein GC175_19485 [bacterium]|nr:hypothetical protein [bacterium]